MAKTFEHKEGQGSIFKNDFKEQDKHPDYKGKVKINGEDKDIALWIKEGKNGKFFSVSISEAYKKPTETVAPKEDSDDLPF